MSSLNQFTSKRSNFSLHERRKHSSEAEQASCRGCLLQSASIEETEDFSYGLSRLKHLVGAEQDCGSSIV